MKYPIVDVFKVSTRIILEWFTLFSLSSLHYINFMEDTAHEACA